MGLTRPRGAPLGVGVDIEEVERFRGKNGGSWWSKAFTRDELDYCLSKSDPAIHLAGTFAAKEAALKSVSRFRAKAPLLDFEVTRPKSGAPAIRYRGKQEPIRALKIEVSISHTADNAVAVAVAYE